MMFAHGPFKSLLEGVAVEGVEVPCDVIAGLEEKDMIDTQTVIGSILSWTLSLERDT